MNRIFVFLALITFVGCKSEGNQIEIVEKQIVPHEEKVIVEAISGLTLPDRIEGGWYNSMESDSRKFVFYSFNEEQMQITHGTNFAPREIQEPYQGYSLKETTDDSTYLIEMNTDEHSISYEFKLYKFDWLEETSLTYAIVENGELLIDHPTSCQLVLNRMKTEED